LLLSKLFLIVGLMHGTFNGVRLRRISSIETVSTETAVLTTFRALERPLRELEAELRVDAPALLIFSNREIEGKTAFFQSDGHEPYRGFESLFLRFPSAG
jgi:hypothetical protein